jgi:hypothetical protein
MELANAGAHISVGGYNGTVLDNVRARERTHHAGGGAVHCSATR